MKRPALFLNEEEYIWHIRSRPRKDASKLHKQAKKTIKKVLKNRLIMEEVEFKILKYKSLYLDFFVPLINLAIEVHGKQHFVYNNFHYKNKLDFARAKYNDQLKIEWCELNDITIESLNYDETEKEWTKKLKNLL